MVQKKVVLLLLAGLCLRSGRATESEQESPIKIYAQQLSGGGYSLYAGNAALIPYHLELDFPTLENLIPSQEIPATYLLPPGARRIELITLTPGTGEKYSYRYSYAYFKGDPWSTRHDDSYLYLFPFAHGEKYRIGQGYNGASTHKGDSRFALDFTMDIGTPVHAARPGLVCGVKEDSDTGGPGEEFAAYGNYVEIYHADGTFATYVHLRQNGAVLEVGQRVTAGQLLGYSGNTGRSSGPHLHFAVSIPLFKGQTSLPTRFLNYDGQPVEPRQGQLYYATHPGRPAYTVLLGSELSNSDYTDHRAAVPATGKLEFRTETIDQVVILFVRNGFAEAKWVLLEFDLTNMQASKPLPCELTVPAFSERFVLLLSAKDYTEAWRYKYKYQYKTAD